MLHTLLPYSSAEPCRSRDSATQAILNAAKLWSVPNNSVSMSVRMSIEETLRGPGGGAERVFGQK